MIKRGMYFTATSKVYVHCSHEEINDVSRFLLAEKLSSGSILPITFVIPAIYIIVDKIERVLSKDEFIALLKADKIVYSDYHKYDFSINRIKKEKERIVAVNNIGEDELYDLLIAELEKREKYEMCANLYHAYEHIYVHS